VVYQMIDGGTADIACAAGYESWHSFPRQDSTRRRMAPLKADPYSWMPMERISSSALLRATTPSRMR
jgi:hypothetical protein